MKQHGIWIVFAAVLLAVILFATVGSKHIHAFAENSVICVEDLNNDGYGDSNEVGYCIQTDQGDLCPIEAVDCISGGGVEISCPDGTVLDSGTNKCVSNPGISCGSGFEYIEEHNVCAADAVCSDGSILNTETNVCEMAAVPDCPSGTELYNWNETYVCKKSPVCAAGSAYNCSTKRCERAASYTCSSGTLRYVSGQYRCYINVPVSYCYTDGGEYGGCSYKTEGTLLATVKCANNTKPAGATMIGYVQWEPQRNVCSWEEHWSTGGSCPSGYTPSGSECYKAATPTCPSGYTPSGSVCYKAATCDSGFIYNANIPSSECPGGGSCYVDSNLCLPGYTYSSSVCTKAPACSSGSYDNDIDKCIIPVSINCPAGTAYNEAENKCEASPGCPAGSVYNAEHNICVRTPECASGDTYNCTSAACERSVSYTCPSGTTLRKVGSSYRCYRSKTTSGACSTIKICTTAGNPAGWGETPETELCEGFNPPAGSIQIGATTCGGCNYDERLGMICAYLKYWAILACPSEYTSDGNECYIAATPTCPSGYTRSGSVCKKNPDCSVFGIGWEFDASKTNAGCKGVCYAQGIQSVCPYGDQYVCMDNSLTGTKQCSPNECFVFIEGTEDEYTEEGCNDKTDKGFSEDGSCDGEIYIFNGYDYRCREAGYKTQWHNCCKTSSSLDDICNDRERTLASMRANGQCHEIGSYCAKKVKLTGTCIQRVKTFCCFSSQFGCLVQTQGRGQFKNEIFWGSPKAPNCIGMTPSQFEMLDFDKIDLTSLYGSYVPPTYEEIGQQGVQSVNEYYEDHVE
jgi:hypothetical protein